MEYKFKVTAGSNKCNSLNDLYDHLNEVNKNIKETAIKLNCTEIVLESGSFCDNTKTNGSFGGHVVVSFCADVENPLSSLKKFDEIEGVDNATFTT